MFACCFVWMWNLVPHVKGWTQTKGISEQRNIRSILYSSLPTAFHDPRNSNNPPVCSHEHLSFGVDRPDHSPSSSSVVNNACSCTSANPSIWSYPCNRPWRPTVLWDVEAPTFSRISAHNGGEVVSLTRRQAALYHQEDSSYSFLLEAES
jgi:hypothetical protein